MPSLTAVDELCRRFVETSDDLMTVVDFDGRFLYVSPAAERVFGLAPEACIGREAWEFVHPDDLETTRRAFQDWLGAHGPCSFRYENRQVSRSGEVREMRWTVTRLDQDGDAPPCLASSARDISDEKRAKHELATSRARYEALVAGMLDPVVTIDAFGVIEDANHSCADVFGYGPDELVGNNIKLLLPEPFRSEHDAYLARYRETGRTNILGRTREFPIQRKDGARIECELSVSRIDVPGREQPLFCGSFRDVTARRAAERALAEREQRFHAIFDQEVEFVGLLLPDGTTIEANRASLDAIGAEREDVLGQPFWETPWWSHSREQAERIRQAVTDAAGGKFVRFETTSRRHGNGMTAIDFSLKPFRDDDGNVVLLLPEGRDITAIKRAQERETAMMRAFADIGESASLLAHEIKNPITSVNLALRAVAAQLGEDERSVLTDLVERMQKLERLMRRTLSLARPLELKRAPLDPGALLGTVVDLLRPHLDHAGVAVEVDVDEDCPALDGDEQLLEDVLTNLVRNAIDALEEGGRVRLEARVYQGMVRLRVDDDGPGIPASIRETLFKPFVTTKMNGTGLGLALARKIVVAHGGSIEAAESPWGGSRFELCLPRAGR